mgnify:CR=1 FL=1
MDFKDNLHFLMESKGIAIKELSEKTGISENTLKSYLKSKPVEPKVTNAFIIAKTLHVSVEFLITGKNDKEKDEFYNLQNFVSSFNSLSSDDKMSVLALMKEMNRHYQTSSF